MRHASGGVIFALVGLLVFGGVGAWRVATDQGVTQLPACPTEDSDNCHWDAHRQGNRTGQSFDVIHGEIHYTN